MEQQAFCVGEKSVNSKSGGGMRMTSKSKRLVGAWIAVQLLWTNLSYVCAGVHGFKRVEDARMGLVHGACEALGTDVKTFEELEAFKRAGVAYEGETPEWTNDPHYAYLLRAHLDKNLGFVGGEKGVMTLECNDANVDRWYFMAWRGKAQQEAESSLERLKDAVSQLLKTQQAFRVMHSSWTVCYAAWKYQPEEVSSVAGILGRVWKETKSQDDYAKLNTASIVQVDSEFLKLVVDTGFPRQVGKVQWRGVIYDGKGVINSLKAGEYSKWFKDELAKNLRLLNQGLVAQEEHHVITTLHHLDSTDNQVFLFVARDEERKRMIINEKERKPVMINDEKQRSMDEERKPVMIINEKEDPCCFPPLNILTKLEFLQKYQALQAAHTIPECKCSTSYLVLRKQDEKLQKLTSQLLNLFNRTKWLWQ